MAHAQLAPHALLGLIAAAGGEPSKVPFYIVGAALAGWAVLLASLGLRSPDFPANLGGQRIVAGISVALAAGTLAAAVATAAKPSQAATTAAASAPAAGASSSLAIAADPSGMLRFDKQQLSAKAGNVTVNFSNASPTAHNFTIEQNGKVVAATPTFQGGSKTLGAHLAPGTYTFLCTVPGHAAAGMHGTLTVS